MTEYECFVYVVNNKENRHNLDKMIFFKARNHKLNISFFRDFHKYCKQKSENTCLIVLFTICILI
jgi:hypothetical protein